ncbi:MAG TPA: type IX secretion system membrane protein PorP/SprF [Saprospiraceae bacterium]|nr:type IX secretion system membrane protein PorP/SprF [Saprospiraceae bacterium]
MKKMILPLLLVALATLRVQAQQEHHYTQFMYNKLIINPAYAGARGIPFLTAIYRNQWIGFDGSPKSALLSFNGPFLSPRVGVGATISHQQIGLQRDFYGALAYSYDLISNDVMSIRVGIMGSVRSRGMNFADAQADPSQANNDPSLDNGNVNITYANVGAGVYGTFNEQFYVGFSVPHIYSNTIGFNTNPFSAPNFTQTAKGLPHMYGMAGAILPISDNVNLMPAVLAKYVKNAPFDVDLNLSLDLNQKFTAGLSYRVGGDGPGESIDLLAYWQATPQLGLGAAYDFSLSQVRDYNAGSVEVLAQIDLKKKKRNMSNPRFFL